MIIDWEKIDTVLLDMDGTLLDLHYDNYYWLEYLPKLYALKYHTTVKHAKQTIEPLLAEKYGQLEWYSTEYWSKKFEIDIAKTKTDKEVVNKISFRPDAKLFLEAIKNKGKRLFLVTNADQHVLKIKKELLDLDEYFDHLISTHEFGFCKESTEFWPAFQQRFPFDPSRSLFVDDNLPILRVAKEYGIAHLRAITLPDSQKPAKDTQEFSPLGFKESIGFVNA